MTLKLFGFGKTRSLKVAWTLEELGLQYDFEQVHPARPPQDFSFRNPYKKVPVLEVNKQAIFETMAICTYLCDRETTSSLLPRSGTIERALHDQWLSVVQTELEPTLWLREKHAFVLPKEFRLPEVFRSVDHDVGSILLPLEDHLSTRQWILGSRFSMADIFLCYCINWAQAYKLVTSDVLKGYLKRGQSRPAFQRAVEKTSAVST